MSSVTKTLSVFSKEKVIVDRERTRGAYSVAPYLLSKLAAELPSGALFPVLFGSLVYPACGLHSSIPRFGRFLAILTAESFASGALGLTVSALAPSASAAQAIGPAGAPSEPPELPTRA